MNSERRKAPVVAFAKMSYSISTGNWGLGIYEKHESFTWSKLSHGGRKH
jgi:hypothetical protein